MRLAEVILQRISERGLSERQVSIAVFGHDTGIRDLKRTGSTSSKRLEALCEYLDLEFYIGPTRRLADEPVPTREKLLDAEVEAAIERGAAKLLAKDPLVDLVRERAEEGVHQIEIISELIKGLRETHTEHLTPNDLAEKVIAIINESGTRKG